jgi:hypothetical protein
MKENLMTSTTNATHPSSDGGGISEAKAFDRLRRECEGDSDFLLRVIALLDIAASQARHVPDGVRKLTTYKYWPRLERLRPSLS